jgi:hypothetical protein
MSTYLLTFRAPKNWAPTADRASAWSAWQQKLAANLKDRGNPVFKADAAWGWAAVLSNLKSLLETGSPLPQEPWLVDETLADRLLRSVQDNRRSRAEVSS